MIPNAHGSWRLDLDAAPIENVIGQRGSGTINDPWTGWDAINWQSHVHYVFLPGYYAAEKAPIGWSQKGMRLSGVRGDTVIRWTNAGNSKTFDGALVVGDMLDDMIVENLIFEGKGNSNYALWVNRFKRCYFRNIRCRDANIAALHITFGQTTIWDGLRISEPDDAGNAYVMNPQPKYGVICDYDSADASYYTTTQTFIHPVIEGIRKITRYPAMGPAAGTLTTGTNGAVTCSGNNFLTLLGVSAGELKPAMATGNYQPSEYSLYRYDNGEYIGTINSVESATSLTLATPLNYETSGSAVTGYRTQQPIAGLFCFDGSSTYFNGINDNLAVDAGSMAALVNASTNQVIGFINDPVQKTLMEIPIANTFPVKQNGVGTISHVSGTNTITWTGQRPSDIVVGAKLYDSAGTNTIYQVTEVSASSATLSGWAAVTMTNSTYKVVPPIAVKVTKVARQTGMQFFIQKEEGIGVDLRSHTSYCTFVGGTIEGNMVGVSISGQWTPSIDHSCNGNKFIGVDLEANLRGDFYINGGVGNSIDTCICLEVGDYHHRYHNAYSDKNVCILSNAKNTVLAGGQITSVYDRSLALACTGVATDVANWDSWWTQTFAQGLNNTKTDPLTNITTSKRLTLLPANDSNGECRIGTPSGSLNT